MAVLRSWDLQLDVDQVLRGQGADPAIIRRRSPSIVALAEKAFREGIPLLRPEMLYRRLSVERVVHDRVVLEAGIELRGTLIGQHLRPAVEVIIMLCTIGASLDEEVSQALKKDMVYGLALDGLGSAAVEVLANAACHQFDGEARARGMETGIPLSPGMMGWPVEEGQPRIFSALQADQIGISVTQSWVMLPRKSLSMVLGIGPHMMGGTSCDYCAMRATCRYQDHYAPG